VKKKTKINVKTLRICKRCQSTEVKSKKNADCNFRIQREGKFQAKKAEKNNTTKTFVGEIQVFRKLELAFLLFCYEIKGKSLSNSILDLYRTIKSLLTLLLAAQHMLYFHHNSIHLDNLLQSS